MEIFRMSTDWPSLAATENPPMLGVDEYGSFQKILCIKCVCIYRYMHFFKGSSCKHRLLNHY